MSREEAMVKLAEFQGPPFQARVMAGFDAIVENHAGGTVAMVCHGGVINVIVQRVLEARHPLAPHHASVTRVMASRSGVRSVATFNEHHWLRALTA